MGRLYTNDGFWSDELFGIQDEADGTKKLIFEVGNITTGTTRTITVPDASGTLVLTDLSSAFGVPDDVNIELGTDDDAVLRLRSTILAANTALTDVLIGTPVAQAVAANSLLLSNVTADGDIAMYVNTGGHSQQVLWADASADLVTIGWGQATVNISPGAANEFIFTATALTAIDDILVSVGTGSTARLSWDTTDANANELLLQLPAGGGTDVPVLIIGDGIESVDFGLYNGIVSTTVALFGTTATATGPAFEFRKSRGTNASPTVVTSGDDMGSIDFYGAVAAGEYVRGARILAEMTGTIATTRGPGVLTFQTATDAAPSVLTTAMTISAAQLVTVAAGLTITTGSLTMGTTASKLVPGATSFSVRNNADNADNLLVTDAGLVTARAGLVATAGGVTVTAGGLRVTAGRIVETMSQTDEATGGNATYLAAAIVGGVINRDCAGGSRSDTTDTAANIIAATPALSADGNCIICYVINTSDAAETITIVGGTGVSVFAGTGATFTSGGTSSQTIAQNETAMLIFRRTSGTTVTMYQIGA